MKNTNGITPEEQHKANVRRAFNNAIERGVFVTDEANARPMDDESTDYVGEWMYMFTADDAKQYGGLSTHDAFKNKITRRYIHVPI